MKTELLLNDRTLTLHRFPRGNNETLQAWDAGDEYLIQHVESLNLPSHQRLLILNDHFGALSCWFSTRHSVFFMSDSFIATTGTQQNLAANHCPNISLLKSTDPLPNDIDIVLIQLPKNNRYLAWQLVSLRKVLPPQTQVIAVNKAKDIHASTLNVFEKYLGSPTTSLAWKKHRLIFCQPEKHLTTDVTPQTQWSVENEHIQLSNLPNVFSGENLDLGARFLLPHLPKNPEFKEIIDLGCGNGVLSVKLAQLNPESNITAVDESYMAVQSANDNFNINLKAPHRAKAVANNCLDGFSSAYADLVVCNPPFHQQNTITDHIAWQMFCDAKQVIKNKGQLLVIGNRHLGYDRKLVRLYGKTCVKLIAQNSKFVILQAIKS